MLTVNQSNSFAQQNNAYAASLMRSTASSPSPHSVCKCGAMHASESIDRTKPQPETKVELEDEIPNNKFGKLIEDLKKILGPDKGLSSEDIDVDKIKEVMELYESDELEWGKYALNDPSRSYTRNGVIDLNGNANLLILVWNPAKSSAIHDHANAHCCMKILKGTLKESLYDFPEQVGNELVPKKETLLHREDVGYISDDIGLHKISNPLDNEVSVSLHLYTPPYASLYGCSMYEAGNGKRHHVDMSKYYSYQGKLINPKDSSAC